MEPLISWSHYASSQVGGALVQANISDQKKLSKKIVCTCNLKYVINLSFFSSGSNFSIVFTIFFYNNNIYFDCQRQRIKGNNLDCSSAHNNVNFGVAQPVAFTCASNFEYCDHRLLSSFFFTFLPYFLSFVTYTSVQRAEFTLYEYVSFDVKFPTKYVMMCFVCGLNLEPLQHIIYIIFAQSLICLSFPYFIFLLCNVKFLTLPCSIFFFNSEVGLNFNSHLLLC